MRLPSLWHRTPPPPPPTLEQRVEATAWRLAEPVLHRAHAVRVHKSEREYFPRSVDWQQSCLRRLHEEFAPSPHVGTRRVQVALHEAVEHAEAGTLRFAMRCAWWWLRRRWHKSAL